MGLGVIRNPKSVTVGGTLATGVKKVTWKTNDEYNRDAADAELHGSPVLVKQAGTFQVEMKAGKFPACYDVDIVVIHMEIVVNAGVETSTDKTTTLHHCTANAGYDVPAAAAGNVTIDGECGDVVGPT